LESIGMSTEELLEIIDGDDKGFRALVCSERYAQTERTVGAALCVPRLSLSARDIDGPLSQVLPLKVCDQLGECFNGFHSRFLVSDVQWAMDGPIAASVECVRSAFLLSVVLSGARRLVEMAFDGPVEVGWIAADHLQFVSDYGECVSDLNKFRGRLLRWCASASAKRVSLPRSRSREQRRPSKDTKRKEKGQ
jgi:hypothetical protein